MSRRLGLRLVPDRVVDDDADGSGDADELNVEPLDPTEGRAAPDDARKLRDQPPALGATPAATPPG